VVASKPIVAVATALAILGAVSAAAQVQRSGGTANPQLMQQYQQAVTERSQLQAENEKLKKNLDDLKKQLDAAQQQLNTAKAGASREQSALSAAQASNEGNVKALADSKAKTQELVSRFRETLTTLHGVETDRTQLQQQLGQSKAAYDKCAERNYELYQVDNEVLERYQHQGMFSYMERAEPFTRLKKTQIDNLALEYKERAEELRVKPAAGSAAPATPAAAAPAATPSAVPYAAPSATSVPQPAASPKQEAASEAADAPSKASESTPKNP
jgi:regulator of replication initiation timing